MPAYTFTYRMPDGSLQPYAVARDALNDVEAFKDAVAVGRDFATGPDKLIPIAIEVRDFDGWLVVTVPVIRR